MRMSEEARASYDGSLLKSFCCCVVIIQQRLFILISDQNPMDFGAPKLKALEISTYIINNAG